MYEVRLLSLVGILSLVTTKDYIRTKNSVHLSPIYSDVVLLHGCPQSCMPNPVEGLLEVYEDMVEVLLVLDIFLIENA